MLGQLDRIGTLKAGKQADLVMIRASDLNMQPVHDAVSSVVMQTSLANIDSVMVAGAEPICSASCLPVVSNEASKSLAWASSVTDSSALAAAAVRD